MLSEAFTLLGAPVTWLEVLAFLLALACVVLSAYEIHWGWPLAFVSSLLYAWLFGVSRLYGEAGLQLFFAATAVWGWWQWLFGHRAGDRQGEHLHVGRLTPRGRAVSFAAWFVAWLAAAALLLRLSDSDVAYADAFATSGSIVGQVLLGRKFIENWLVWLVVNLFSIGLFAYKGLWLTAILYVIFAALAWFGWYRWSRQLPPRPALVTRDA
jgi:nicotinamide mononucleotide transporter